jgi:DNA-binding transcriptional ArsR family regulator
MATDAHREFKNRLYGQFARIGKALSSAHRLEMLELLAQGERTVDSLAGEMGLSLASTSQHLQALRHASLVASRKAGLFVHYRRPTRRSTTCAARSAVSPRISWPNSIAWCGDISPTAPTRKRCR